MYIMIISDQLQCVCIDPNINMIKLVMCLKTMLQLLNTKLKRENFRIEKLGIEKHIVSIKFISSYEFLKGDRL